MSYKLTWKNYTYSGTDASEEENTPFAFENIRKISFVEESLSYGNLAQIDASNPLIEECKEEGENEKEILNEKGNNESNEKEKSDEKDEKQEANLEENNEEDANSKLAATPDKKFPLLLIDNNQQMYMENNTEKESLSETPSSENILQNEKVDNLSSATVQEIEIDRKGQETTESNVTINTVSSEKNNDEGNNSTKHEVDFNLNHAERLSQDSTFKSEEDAEINSNDLTSDNAEQEGNISVFKLPRFDILDKGNQIIAILEIIGLLYC